MAFTRNGRSSLFLPHGQARGVTFGNLQLWAEEGLVNWVDKTTGFCGHLKPNQARVRLRTLFKGVGTSSNPGFERDAQDRANLYRVAEAVEEVIRKAEAQGPPIVTRVVSGPSSGWNGGKLVLDGKPVDREKGLILG